jgi:hypothetical protein
VSLSALNFAGRIVRRAQVAKLRGRAHLTGEHLMHITEHGIAIVPQELPQIFDRFHLVRLARCHGQTLVGGWARA